MIMAAFVSQLWHIQLTRRQKKSRAREKKIERVYILVFFISEQIQRGIMIGTLVRHETCARVFLLCFFENADLIVVTEHCIGQRRKAGTRFAFAQNWQRGVTSTRLVGERFFFPPGYE